MEEKENLEGGAALVQPLPVEDAMSAHHEVHATARNLATGAEAEFNLPENAALLEVLEEGAKHLGVQLLPPAPQKPLDRLHDITHHGQVGPAIDNLDQTLGAYLKEKGTTAHFGIELVLAFRVNVRWAVAAAPQMTPRQILALPAINLPYEQYTLYLPGSSDPLTLDTPITITRGEALEAQRDGKYGGRE